MNSGDFIAGKYRLSRLLGEGAMGVVWAATDVRTEAEVALKLIRQAPEISQEQRTRLFREARACGRIRHRNVVEVYDVGETSAGQAFLVMQVLHGESLADRLAREGRIAVPAAIAIASDIARGLGAAHAVNIVHRDLKPANVFLDRDPEVEGPVVKLVDFGVSKLLGPQDASSTATGSVMGSPAYMSPEQARGAKTIDHRTDVWALGVVLFEMLAGRRPFLGDTAFAVVGEIFTAPIPDLRDVVPGIDPRIAHAVSRCLERDVQQRMGSTAELLAVLHALEEDGPISATKVMPSPPRDAMDSHASHDSAHGSARGPLAESESEGDHEHEHERETQPGPAIVTAAAQEDPLLNEPTAVHPRTRRPEGSSAVTSTTPFIQSGAASSNAAKEHAAPASAAIALGALRGPTRATAMLAVSGAVAIVLLAGVITLVSLRGGDTAGDVGRASAAAPGDSQVAAAPPPGEGAPASPVLSTGPEIAPTAAAPTESAGPAAIAAPTAVPSESAGSAAAAAPTESAGAASAAAPTESARAAPVPPPVARPKQPPRLPPRPKPKRGVAIPKDPG
jgi:serine/threonine-protein kinase